MHDYQMILLTAIVSGGFVGLFVLLLVVIWVLDSHLSYLKKKLDRVFPETDTKEE